MRSGHLVLRQKKTSTCHRILLLLPQSTAGTGREHRSLNARRGHGTEQYETPCGRRIRGKKDDCVWAAARTGRVLVTAGVAQSPNGTNEPGARRWPFGDLDPELHLRTCVHPHTRTFAPTCAMPPGACIMDWPGRLASSD